MPAITTIKLRRDEAADWTAANPVLALGEPGLEEDTGLLKFGDGTTAWADLDYFNPVPSGTYGEIDAAKNTWTGKQELNGGFTNGYDTDLWIAGPVRASPTNNSQGMYIQHRVSGDLGGLVHDAGASELRLSGASNTGAGQSAHENSLVISGGVNAANLLVGCLANFHTEGTPTGTVAEVSLFRASQIPAVPGGLTIARATSLHLDNQIVGTENFTLYAPNGLSALGPLVPKDSSSIAVIARGRSDTVGGTALLAVQNSTPTTLFQVTSSGTGGVGGAVSGTSWWVNNNLASVGAHALTIKARASQTGDQLRVTDENNAVLSRIGPAGRYITKVATVPALADLSDGELALSTDARGGLVTTTRLAGALKTTTELFARKTGDTTATSTTTLANDADLVLPLDADATYIFDLTAFYDGSSTGDFKAAFTVPSGATLLWHHLAATPSVTTLSNTTISWAAQATSGTAIGNAGATAAATKVPYRARGIVRTAGTAGNLTLQWAQGTSDPTATTLFTDSFLTARRVA